MSGLGLLFSGLGGGGGALKNIGEQEQKAREAEDLRKSMMDMELEKTKAIEDYKSQKKVEANKDFQAKVDDITAERYAGMINSKFGSSMTGEDAKGLLGNDAARKEYGIADMSDTDRLKLQAEAAARMGDSDRSDSINKQITTQQHHEDSMKKLDASIAATEAATNRAWAQNDDANKRAQANVHLEEAKAYGNEIKTLADKMNAGDDPRAIAAQQAVIDELKAKKANAFSSALSILNGGKGEEKQDQQGASLSPEAQARIMGLMTGKNSEPKSTSGTATDPAPNKEANPELAAVEKSIAEKENMLKTGRYEKETNFVRAAIPGVYTKKKLEAELNELYLKRGSLLPGK